MKEETNQGNEEIKVLQAKLAGEAEIDEIERHWNDQKDAIGPGKDCQAQAKPRQESKAALSCLHVQDKAVKRAEHQELSQDFGHGPPGKPYLGDVDS